MSYSRLSLMINASRTQFHVERPWGLSRGLLRAYEPSDGTFSRTSGHLVSRVRRRLATGFNWSQNITFLQFLAAASFITNVNEDPNKSQPLN